MRDNTEANLIQEKIEFNIIVHHVCDLDVVRRELLTNFTSQILAEKTAKIRKEGCPECNFYVIGVMKTIVAVI
jgi:hypothetical protein